MQWELEGIPSLDKKGVMVRGDLLEESMMSTRT